ncbi:Methionine aminopeptidase [Nitrosotalea sinensis]|jgi:methionyl aminopeptidase|uniref:Methionine aminopeptidase n=1 Tax=Nitrosotalea sinensis TaxID=1499975 RepID=A0A2H1EIX0_9ARCH|nr:type II methionyl aminopeptidase [Candidatus Nitrosotalea sinensis]SHO47645.1 Methionine aminopeptidase [Candidatus Nitrosotalea sinensis]
MQLQDYINAGKIASEVRENARRKDHVGSTLEEICNSIEKEINDKGGKCAFPVNVSLNDIAAHYTAEPNDSTTVKDTDLLKIDLGVQINGHIADTAVTVCYDPKYDFLVQAAESALKEAMSIIRVGTKSSDVGKTIENTTKQMGGIPIANLSGHSLEQYTIHAGKSVPNIWSIGSFSFQSTEAYACEPFVTTPEGSGFVREGKIRNIFSLVTRKRTKEEDTNKMIDFIWQKFNMLPFALRWLIPEFEEKNARELLDKLIKNKIVRSYPILVEANNQRVAQAEHTFIPQANGVLVTTL